MESILIISSVLLWIVVLSNLLLTLALVRHSNTFSKPGALPKPEMLKAGDKAPDFTMQSLDGQTVTQSDYTNQKLVMVFIAPGCKPCLEQMPTLQELYPKAKKLGVELMLISLESVDLTREYAEEHNFTVPILSVNGDTSFRDTYKVPGTPSYYLIDQQRKIEQAGYFDEEWKKLVAQWD